MKLCIVLYMLLAAANFVFSSIINDTYVVLHGDTVKEHATMWYHVVVEVLSDFQIYFFLFVILATLSMISPLIRIIYMVLYVVYRMFRPCIPIRRFQVTSGTARARGLYYTQGEVEPGEAGPSVTIDSSPPSNTADLSISDPNSALVEEATPEALVHASVIGEQTECEETRNFLFSGPLVTATLPYKRRRPKHDLVFRSNSSEYNTMAKVDSFIFNNTFVVGQVIYTSSVNRLIQLSPKFNFIRTMWTWFRFGVRIVIQPTVNPMASGCFVASINSTNQNSNVPQSAHDINYNNIGVFPHVFMQCSSNQHAELVIPDCVLDRWLNNENISGASPQTLSAHFLGMLNVYCVCPYSANTGGPTALRYNVHLQLINIHLKWPQVARYLTQGNLRAQGLFDFNTNTTVIKQMRDSTLCTKMRGGEGQVSMSGFGLDYPSDTRQYPAMLRRIFPKMFASRGTIDVNRLTFNGCDSSSFPFEGQDEMSISYLMSRINYITNVPFSSVDVADSLLLVSRILPDLSSLTASNSNVVRIQDAIYNTGLNCEFDEIVFTFVVPKVPYQNGKYLVTVTGGINPPATLDASNLSLTSAPNLVIDLSAPDVSHELRIPFTLLAEYYASGWSLRSTRQALPRLAIYALNPVSTNVLAPSRVICSIFRSFVNYRIVNPITTLVTEGEVTKGGKGSKDGDCVSTGCKITVPSDAVFTKNVDDAISLKQLQMPFVIAMVREAELINTFPFAQFEITYESVIRSLPFGSWYRFWNGSLRLGIQVIPYVASTEAATLDITTSVEAVLLTFVKRSYYANVLTSNRALSFWGNYFNNQPQNQAYPTRQTQSFQEFSFAGNPSGPTGLPNYPQFPILFDPRAEKICMVEIPITGPNGYVDLLPLDAAGRVSDAPCFSINVAPQLRGDLPVGFRLKVIMWAAAGDDLQGWGINPNSNSKSYVARRGRFTTGFVEDVAPLVGSTGESY